MTQNLEHNDVLEIGGGQGREPRIINRDLWKASDITGFLKYAAVFLVVAILVVCGAGTYITHLK